jgi:hypothetical protein
MRFASRAGYQSTISLLNNATDGRLMACGAVGEACQRRRLRLLAAVGQHFGLQPGVLEGEGNR